MPEPKVPQKSPYVQEMSPGKYAWCSCGKSANQPLCDGSHRDTEFSPIIIEVEQTKTVSWCGCKHTQNPPFCDGSHNGV